MGRGKAGGVPHPRPSEGNFLSSLSPSQPFVGKDGGGDFPMGKRVPFSVGESPRARQREQARQRERARRRETEIMRESETERESER